MIIFILNTMYVKYYVLCRLQWAFHLLLLLNAWYYATQKFFASRLKSTEIPCVMLSTNVEQDIRLSSVLFQEIAAWEYNANKFKIPLYFCMCHTWDLVLLRLKFHLRTFLSLSKKENVISGKNAFNHLFIMSLVYFRMPKYNISLSI